MAVVVVVVDGVVVVVVVVVAVVVVLVVVVVGCGGGGGVHVAFANNIVVVVVVVVDVVVVFVVVVVVVVVVVGGDDDDDDDEYTYEEANQSQSLAPIPGVLASPSLGQRFAGGLWPCDPLDDIATYEILRISDRMQLRYGIMVYWRKFSLHLNFIPSLPTKKLPTPCRQSPQTPSATRWGHYAAPGNKAKAC